MDEEAIHLRWHTTIEAILLLEEKVKALQKQVEELTVAARWNSKPNNENWILDKHSILNKEICL